MTGATRLVQLEHPGFGRRVALVDGGDLHLLGTYRSVYQFAQTSLETGYKMRDLLSTDLSGVSLDYGKVWALETEWRFLPSLDHPDEPGRCQVSGSGMNWFSKGNGLILRGHGNPLEAPDFAESAVEEAGIAAAYIIDRAGAPRRVGLTPANEFCDPAGGDGASRAQGKLRPCSIGPELWLDAAFEEIRGSVVIVRDSQRLWSAELLTGDRNTAHSLADVEASLFRHAGHRRPGDVHVHFLGSPLSSYAQGVRLQDGDEMIIAWEGFGQPLVNRVRKAAAPSPAVASPL